MNTKKMLASVCAGAMALSLTVPAFAAPTDPITNDAAVTFSGAPATGEIAVVMQTGATNLYVNPYGLPYMLGNGEVMAGSTFDKDTDLAIAEAPTSNGFFSDTAVIQNNGETALAVKVSMTTTEKGAVKVVATAPTGSVADHTLNGNLEIAPATVVTGTAKVTGASGKVDMADVKIVTPDWDDKETVAIPAGSGTAGSAGTPSAVADTGVVLPAATSSLDAASGQMVTTPGYVAYRLAGSAYLKSATDWEEQDVADVAVAFTFAPATTSNP